MYCKHLFPLCRLDFFQSLNGVFWWKRVLVLVPSSSVGSLLCPLANVSPWSFSRGKKGKPRIRMSLYPCEDELLVLPEGKKPVVLLPHPQYYFCYLSPWESHAKMGLSVQRFSFKKMETELQTTGRAIRPQMQETPSVGVRKESLGKSILDCHGTFRKAVRESLSWSQLSDFRVIPHHSEMDLPQYPGHA